VIYHVIGDKPTALSPVPAEKRRSAEGYQGGIANPWGTKRIKADFVLPGAKALYRIAERQPVFLVRSFPEGSGTILRLTPKADERSITITVVSFKIAMIPGPTGPREEDAVKIDLKMDRGGTFRIVPKQPLEPGEYAYVVGAAQGNPIFFFEFGID
jgi:hypothetical protein